LGIKLGSNDGCTAYEQDNVECIAKLDKLLQTAGGKPAECELADFSQGGQGKAKPEFIIMFDKKPNTIDVIECKKAALKHQSEKRNKPKGFAVDSVLYYAKFLKQEYNVIAVAVSSAKKDNWKVTAFNWRKGQTEPQELPKGKDILYSPENYLRLVSGEQIRKAVSIVEVQKLAWEMQDKMRRSVHLKIVVYHFNPNTLESSKMRCMNKNYLVVNTRYTRRVRSELHRSQNSAVKRGTLTASEYPVNHLFHLDTAFFGNLCNGLRRFLDKRLP
jgi:hypothetical protein